MFRVSFSITIHTFWGIFSESYFAHGYPLPFPRDIERPQQWFKAPAVGRLIVIVGLCIIFNFTYKDIHVWIYMILYIERKFMLKSLLHDSPAPLPTPFIKLAANVSILKVCP